MFHFNPLSTFHSSTGRDTAHPHRRAAGKRKRYDQHYDPRQPQTLYPVDGERPAHQGGRIGRHLPGVHSPPDFGKTHDRAVGLDDALKPALPALILLHPCCFAGQGRVQGAAEKQRLLDGAPVAVYARSDQRARHADVRHQGGAGGRERGGTGPER